MRRWGGFVIRACVALAIAFIVMSVPWVLPVPVLWVYTGVPIVVFALICYLGKLLYDTLFYDRFQP